MSVKKKPAPAPPTVVTITLNTDGSGTILARRGDLAHMSQFQYEGLQEIVDALQNSGLQLQRVEANPPPLVTTSAFSAPGPTPTEPSPPADDDSEADADAEDEPSDPVEDEEQETDGEPVESTFPEPAAYQPLMSLFMEAIGQGTTPLTPDAAQWFNDLTVDLITLVRTPIAGRDFWGTPSLVQQLQSQIKVLLDDRDLLPHDTLDALADHIIALVHEGQSELFPDIPLYMAGVHPLPKRTQPSLF